MRFLIFSKFFFALFVSSSFAGQTTYGWFDLRNCTSHSISSDDTAMPPCFTYYSPIFADGELTGFSFGDVPACGNLAGTTFKIIKDKGDLKSFRCVAGCRKHSPMLLHDEGEERTGDEVNIEETRMLEIFNRRCATKGSKWVGCRAQFLLRRMRKLFGAIKIAPYIFVLRFP